MTGRTATVVTLMACFLVVFFSLPSALAAPDIANIESLCHVYQKDINIALLRGVSWGGDDGSFCRTKLGSSSAVPKMEALKYALDLINARVDLLPNISLGYVVVDGCFRDLPTLAHSLYLMPDPDDRNTLPPWAKENCTQGHPRFRVSGIIGPSYSRSAVMVGGVATLFHVPTIALEASSDELSDKTRFRYVMRMVPPDRFQADAILDFLLEFGWTYVTLLYMEGSYGENGAKQIQKRTKVRGICIAYSHMFSSDFGEEETVEVVENLKRYKKARAIIAFIGSSVQSPLYEQIEKAGLGGYFIWVGSDDFSSRTGNEGDGSFSISFPQQDNEAFLRFFETLTPLTRKENPWFRDYWERIYDCEWNTSAGNKSCFLVENIPKKDNIRKKGTSRIMDAVFVFAYALHSLIEGHCPEGFKDKALLENCVTGERLLPLLLNTTFQGYNSKVKFDESGDFIGQYIIGQYLRKKELFLPVARWDKETKSISATRNIIEWYMYDNQTGTAKPPESVCSKPCGEKEYFIQKELMCCWECRRCRDNEIIVDNKTACRLCPIFTWPDDKASLCVPIEAQVLQWTSPLSIVLVSFASLGLLLCLGTAAIFFKNSHVRLIKASSRQLMSIILAGIALAYMTVFFLIMKPSTVSCYVTRFGFNLAVSFIYTPLMVKTNRIYRIFTAGKRGVKRPAFIGTRAQLLIVTSFLLIEVALIVVSVVIAPPEPTMRMQVPTEKYVELFCALPLPGLLPPLTSNLTFLLVCALYGFLTRKLPENFNESWYIFVSVATTTFLWLVFLPAYFTAFYASHQVTLLASCLTINGLVTLLCLYLPKIYAVYFLNEDSLQLQNASTVGTSVGSGHAGTVGTTVGPGSMAQHAQTSRTLTIEQSVG